MATSVSETESKVLQLAADIAECQDGEDVVRRLLQLQGLLDMCPLGGPALSAVRRRALDCGLVHACVDALTQVSVIVNVREAGRERER